MRSYILRGLRNGIRAAPNSRRSVLPPTKVTVRPNDNQQSGSAHLNTTKGPDIGAFPFRRISWADVVPLRRLRELQDYNRGSKTAKLRSFGDQVFQAFSRLGSLMRISRPAQTTNMGARELLRQRDQHGGPCSDSLSPAPVLRQCGHAHPAVQRESLRDRIPSRTLASARRQLSKLSGPRKIEELTARRKADATIHRLARTLQSDRPA